MMMLMMMLVVLVMMLFRFFTMMTVMLKSHSFSLSFDFFGKGKAKTMQLSCKREKSVRFCNWIAIKVERVERKVERGKLSTQNLLGSLHLLGCGYWHVGEGVLNA